MSDHRDRSFLDKYTIVQNPSPRGFARFNVLYNDYHQVCDFQILEMNDVYANVTGWDMLSSIGKNLSDIIGPDEISFLTDMCEALTTGKKKTFIYFAQRENRYYRGKGFLLNNGEYIRTLSDITEQYQAELELQDQLKFREKISLLIPAFLYITDCCTEKILWLNNGFEKIWGYALEERLSLSQKDWETMCHPDDCEKIKNYFRVIEESKGNELISEEYRVKHKNGRWVWVYAATIPFKRDDTGRLLQTLSVYIAINRLKEAEAALQIHKKQFEQLVSMLPMVVCKCDEQLKVLYINNMGRALFGDPKGEAIEFNKYITAAECAPVISKIHNQQIGAAPFLCLTHCITATGKIIDVIVTVKRYAAQSDTSIFLVAIIPLREVLAGAIIPDSDFYTKYSLTNTEKTIVELLLKGYTKQEIMDKMDCVEGTIKRHLHNIYSKMGITSFKEFQEKIQEYLTLHHEPDGLLSVLIRELFQNFD